MGTGESLQLILQVSVYEACYGELKVPNVPKTHSWTPDKVKSLSHAGDLYVCAFKPLVINLHNEENTSNASDTSNESKSQVSDATYTPMSVSKDLWRPDKLLACVCVCVCILVCGYTIHNVICYIKCVCVCLTVYVCMWQSQVENERILFCTSITEKKVR